MTSRSYRSPNAQAVHTGGSSQVESSPRQSSARQTQLNAYVKTFSVSLLAPCTLRSRIERRDNDGACGVVFPLEELACCSLRIRTAPVMPALIRTLLLDDFEHRRQVTLTISLRNL